MLRGRHIFRALSGLFYAAVVIVLALLVVAWVRSYVWRDDISRAWSVAWLEKTSLASPPLMARHDRTGFWIVSSGAGVLAVARSSTEHVQAIPYPSASPFTLSWIHDVRPPSSPAPSDTPFPFDRLGFGYSLERTPAWKHVTIGAGEQYWSKEWYLGLAFPYWALIMPLAFVLAFQPAKRAWQRWRHRLTPGLCQTCSYDLRAHCIGDKCPECGTPKSAPGGAITAFPSLPPALRTPPGGTGPAPDAPHNPTVA